MPHGRVHDAAVALHPDMIPTSTLTDSVPRANKRAPCELGQAATVEQSGWCRMARRTAAIPKVTQTMKRAPPRGFPAGVSGNYTAALKETILRGTSLATTPLPTRVSKWEKVRALGSAFQAIKEAGVQRAERRERVGWVSGPGPGLLQPPSPKSGISPYGTPLSTTNLLKAFISVRKFPEADCCNHGIGGCRLSRDRAVIDSKAMAHPEQRYQLLARCRSQLAIVSAQGFATARLAGMRLTTAPPASVLTPRR